MRFGEVDRLLPGEEDHLPRRNLRRFHSVEWDWRGSSPSRRRPGGRGGRSGSAGGPSLARTRRRSRRCNHFSISSAGRRPSGTRRSGGGCTCHIAPIGLLGRWARADGHGKELLGPLCRAVRRRGDRAIGPGRCRLASRREPLGIELARRTSRRADARGGRGSGHGIPPLRRSMKPISSSSRSLGACGEHTGSETGVSEGFRRSLPVCHGQTENGP